MSRIIDVISQMNMFISSGAVSENQIKEAEDKLEIRFSEEYKEYISAFGTLSYYGHELTGICEGDASINVVDVTLAERLYFPNIPQEWYVIEQTHFDEIVIWQDTEGRIYRATPYNIDKICDSLKEYITVD